MIHSQQHRNVEFRTLGPVASIRLKQKILGVLAGAIECRLQDLGHVATGGEKQLTFRTARAPCDHDTNGAFHRLLVVQLNATKQTTPFFRASV